MTGAQIEGKAQIKTYMEVGKPETQREVSEREGSHGPPRVAPVTRIFFTKEDMEKIKVS